MINELGQDVMMKILVYHTSRKSIYKKYETHPVRQVMSSLLAVYWYKYWARPDNAYIGVSKVHL